MKMKTKKEIVEMIDKLYTILNNHPEQTLRIITYTDCLSWVLGEDYLDQYIKEIECQDKQKKKDLD